MLRELILNALIHRNYFETGAEVQIKLYPDRLIITNPCSWSKELDVEKLFGNSLRPNPLLAEVFERAGFIERAGTGLLRVNRLLTEQNLQRVKISLEGAFFVAEVLRTKHKTTVMDYSKWQNGIINFLAQTSTSKNTNDIAEHLGISSRAVRNELLYLLKNKIVVRVKYGRNITYRLS